MRPRTFWTFALSTVFGSLIAGAVLTMGTAPVAARPPRLAQIDGVGIDNVDLYKMFEADQADRLAVIDGTKPESQIRGKEKVRLKKVLDMTRRDRLHSAADFHRAATIVQRSEKPSDILFAHDLALTALALGQRDAAAIAASTEDRFLIATGLRQRYGTQYERLDVANALQLSPVADDVTDTMRSQLGLPSLSEAKGYASSLKKASKEG